MIFINKIIIGLFVVVIGGLVGWYYVGGSTKLPGMNIGKQMPIVPSLAVEDVSISDEAPVTGQGKGGVSDDGTVIYTSTGFSPSVLTVQKGTVVTFRNTTTKGMWVASDSHPSHQLLPGFDHKKSVMNGGMYEYTFTKVGTWKYHNHVNPSDTAVVVVTE